MLNEPNADLNSWINFYTWAPIPVLKRTAMQLAQLREDEDRVNGRQIASVVLQDPLMALKVLAFLEAHRRTRQTTDITTIDRAIMMMGVSPFFRAFENMPTVEEQLKAWPRALIGLLKVVTRAKRASEYARDWAVLRHDLDVEEITVAALLHHFMEILAWCFAPELSLKVKALRTENPHMRTRDAQVEIFGISGQEVQMALVETWHLPDLLVTLMINRGSDHPRLRNVTLAIDLARHSANGWDDPALPDDYHSISELLHINQETLLTRLGRDPDDPTQVADPMRYAAMAAQDEH